MSTNHHNALPDGWVLRTYHKPGAVGTRYLVRHDVHGEIDLGRWANDRRAVDAALDAIERRLAR